MTLRQQQSLFIYLLPRLIDFAYSKGYELTGGELYRTPEQAALNAKTGVGISNSLHTKRLAIDLLLFKDGQYLTDNGDYRPLGDYWKTLHPLARWGGDFQRKDGNHFSIEWEGVR